MKSVKEPGILTGALTGLMLTAALTAVFYAGWKLAGLPFVPFDLFDWTARILPGALIEFVISAMVAAIRFLDLGPTSEVAKAIEQAMGIAGLLITGAIAGAVLFGIVRRMGGLRAYLPGLAIGAALGIPVLIISFSVTQTASAAPIVNALWILVLFLLWGMALGMAYRQLLPASAREPVSVTQASVEPVNRRQFLIRLAGYTATITVSGAVVGMLAERLRGQAGPDREKLWSANHALPNAGAAVKPAPGTRPEYTPLGRHYRIDINTVPPAIDEQTWRLMIEGLVEKPLALTLDQLRSYEPMHHFITLSCISNPVGGDLIGTIRWTGVSLRRLLPDLGLKPGATHLKLRSADGFWEVVPIDTINSDERVMLVYAWDGVPLTAEHGFPLRIYIPDLHGMKQPKWIEALEALDHWEAGYWVVRGWDRVARMKATSVIDAIAVNMSIVKADQRMRVPVGGIAHAGARGISRVEVRVDDGAWQRALLRAPLSDLTWVIWRYDWPFEPGEHTFTVRCFDGTGAPQIVESRPPAPSGASGLHGKSMKL